MADVHVYPGDYVTPTKTFVQRYMPQLVQIYQRAKHGPATPPAKKVVIFDLDETIGSFGDLYTLWKYLHAEKGYPAFEESERQLHRILDLYPEAFRPGIFAVLEYIYRKIQAGSAHPVHVYTNNQCDAPNWVDMILTYIENRIGKGLFAYPICAFKIGGKRVNVQRTSHDKTPADFVKCSLVPRNAEMCFVDDQTHDYMKTRKIYYIQPPPYHQPLTREEIMSRFSRSALCGDYFSGKDRLSCVATIIERDRAGADAGREIEDKIGRKIMYFVREFFLANLAPAQTTRRRRTFKLNGTRSRSRNKL